MTWPCAYTTSCTVQRVIGACDFELLPDWFVYGACGGVTKPSGILNLDDHLSGGSLGPDDCIVSIVNSDTIGSDICHNVGHGGLVVELATSGHQAIFEWGS